MRHLYCAHNTPRRFRDAPCPKLLCASASVWTFKIWHRSSIESGFSPEVSLGFEISLACRLVRCELFGESTAANAICGTVYSVRKASIGSVDAARRAGHQAANRLVITSSALAPASAIGSRGVTPKMRLRNACAPRSYAPPRLLSATRACHRSGSACRARRKSIPANPALPLYCSAIPAA